MNGQTEKTDQQPGAEEGPQNEADVGLTEESSGEADEQMAAEADPLAEAEARAAEHWDKYLRAVAELENVRKRAAKDVENARKFALERFGSDLLAVLDSMEMGLQSAEYADADALREGTEATLKLLMTTLERFGITEIDPQGEPFDPELHEAMTMQPSGDVEPGTVLTVFQKGYVLNGRLLRPARVIVSQELPSDDQ